MLGIKHLKKVKDQRGETILEVLLSLVIVALCISFFVNSLVSANEGNKTLNKGNYFNFNYSEGDKSQVKVTIVERNASGVRVSQSSVLPVCVDICEYDGSHSDDDSHSDDGSHSYYYVSVPDNQ